MNRRTFLKKVGLVVVGSLGVIGEPAQKVWSRTIFKGMFKGRKLSDMMGEGNDMPIVANSNLFGTKVIESCKKRFQGSHCLKPVMIGENEYFVGVMHPQQKYDLDVMIARDKYKHEQWVKRYNRWARTKGYSPYQEIEGEVGTLYA